MVHSSEKTDALVSWASTAPPDSSPKRGWGKVAGLLFVAVACLLFAYMNVLSDVVRLWVTEPLYNHGILIVPASLYFIFARRRLIAAHVPEPAYLGLFVLGALSFANLIAAGVSIEIVQQFTVVAMLVTLIGAIVGKEIFLVLLFPLGLLFFAVPFGADLTPILQDLTAAVTVEALNLLDIPVYQEGRFLMVPGMRWEVAESCVGLQYIFPSLALGYAFAGTVFQRWLPRIIFMGAAFVMPILANFARAIFIVLVTLASASKLGLGGDHYAYAWVIFGVMEFALFWVGLRWKERQSTDVCGTTRTPAATIGLAAPPLGRIAVVAVFGVGLSILPVMVSIEPKPVHLQPHTLSTLPRPDAPWSSRPELSGEWKPLSDGALGVVDGTFSAGQDEVQLSIAFHGIQKKGEKLFNIWQPLIDRNEGLLHSETNVPVFIQEEKVLVSESVVTNAASNRRYLVWNWYWIDSHITGNPYYAKIFEGAARVWGRSRGALVVLITEDRDDRQEGREVLQGFASSLGNLDEFLSSAFIE